jgi:uncharacterized protein YjbI with pentapeptide repeats
LSNTRLFYAIFWWHCCFTGANFSNARFCEVSWHESSRSGQPLVDLRQVNFTNAYFYDARFYGCNLSHSTFHNANLQGASFGSDSFPCDLTGVSLEGVFLDSDSFQYFSKIVGSSELSR